MTIAQRMEDGRWPTNDPTAGWTRSGLVMLLDAGNSASWSGSGTWNNLCANPADGSAQSAYNFSLSGIRTPTSPGKKTAAEAMYPNGTTSYASCAPTGVVNTLHRAGSAFTVAAVVQPDAISGYQEIFETGGATDNTRGIEWSIWQGSGAMRVVVANGNYGFTWGGSLSLTRFRYNFVALTFQDGGTASFYVNGAMESTPCTITSPSGSPANNCTLMNGSVNAARPWLRDNAMAAFALWNRPLSQDELDAMFFKLRTRWDFPNVYG